MENERWLPKVNIVSSGLPTVDSNKFLSERNIIQQSNSRNNNVSIGNHMIEVKAHHNVRHRVDAKKPPKHSPDDSAILNTVLNRQCECKGSCFLNYSVNEVIALRKEFDYIHDEEKTENEMYVTLLHYLAAHSLPSKIPGSHLIGTKYYHFIFMCHPGVYICPNAFCRIIGVCEKKLRAAANYGANYGTSLPLPIPKDDEKYAPKEEQICSFLTHVKQHLTHEVECERRDGSIFKYDSIIGFHERKELYDFYVSMLEKDAPSYAWFYHVWLEKFPNLHTSTDRPCVECNDFIEKIKVYELRGDVVSVSAERIRMQEHVGMF